MTHAIQIHETGGPDVMKWEEVTIGDPSAGQIRVKHTAVGLNFIDTYHRSGLYPLELPSGIGMEGAGVVEAVGDGVLDLAVGDRVAYASPPVGSYAEARLMPADRVVKITGNVDDKTAAAMMLQGMTVEYLLQRTYKVKPGQTVLYHAAAGGVGLIFCQWAKHIGATVIGTVGSDEKAELAKAHGCAHTINYNTENFAERVRDLTDGQGVPVVYDGVGQSTFEGSLDCLQPFGLMVSFGQSSGPIAPFNSGILAAKGSLFFTRPTLMTYTAKREDLVQSAKDLFDVVGSGAVKINVNHEFALKDAVAAHKALEGRQTTGSVVLVP